MVLYDYIGLVNIDVNKFFTLSPVSLTRGHRYELYKPHSTGIRSNFFCVRVIIVWNNLHADVIFSTINTFKRTVYIASIFLVFFDGIPCSFILCHLILCTILYYTILHRGADPGGAGGAAAPPILILVVQTYHFAPPIIPVHK